MKLDPILDISPEFKQVVTEPTRKDKILDPIITTLSKFYQKPEIKPPLDNDLGNNGKPTDHKTVYMVPITNISFLSSRTKRSITYRPLPQSGILKMCQWIVKEDWSEIYNAETAHLKAEILQLKVLNKLDECLPEKMITISSDDQPWVTAEIKRIERNLKREYLEKKKNLKV